MNNGDGRKYKGYSKVLRDVKRMEAEQRNAITLPERRKKNRNGITTT